MYLVALNLLVKTTTQLVIAAHNCHTGINKILLENILPAHVAEHYLLGVQGVSGILQDSNVMLSFLYRTQARTRFIFGLKSRVLKLKFLA